MQQTLILRRSAVSGNKPSIAKLALGELAINTYDGKIFIRRSGSSGDTIEEVIITNAENTGSLFISGSHHTLIGNLNVTGLTVISGSLTVTQGITSSLQGSASYALSSSYALTASYALNTVTIDTGSFIKNSQTSSMSVASSSVAISSSYALTASYVIGGVGSSYQIATGSISASVSTDPTSLFLIKSGSTQYVNISSSGDTTIYSNLFIIKNFTTQQPVLTVSQSVVQFATQSTIPTGNITAGSIWFTSSSMYIGLE